MQFARYTKVSIALRYGNSRPRISSFFKGENIHYYHQMTNQSLEYSNDGFYPYESSSGLPLFILTGEQEFHLECVQFASQDKIIFYRDLSSLIHFFI